MLIRPYVAVVCLLLVFSTHDRATSAEDLPLPAALGQLAQLQAPASAFQEREQPLPANGAVRKETRQVSVAPFRIITSGSSHHLLKLFDQSTAKSKTPKSILSLFVRAGSTTQIEVPLGTYVIRCAAGEKWYGYKHLFGPDTSFTELDDSFSFSRQGKKLTGHSVTLYSVAGGNLSTSASDATAFGD